MVSRGHIKSDPKSIFETPLGPKDDPLYQATSQHRNWIECIRAASSASARAEVGHRIARSICHLGFNPASGLRGPGRAEVPRDERRQLLERPLPEPWKL